MQLVQPPLKIVDRSILWLVCMWSFGFLTFAANFPVLAQISGGSGAQGAWFEVSRVYNGTTTYNYASPVNGSAIHQVTNWADVNHIAFITSVYGPETHPNGVLQGNVTITLQYISMDGSPPPQPCYIAVRARARWYDGMGTELTGTASTNPGGNYVLDTQNPGGTDSGARAIRVAPGQTSISFTASVNATADAGTATGTGQMMVTANVGWDVRSAHIVSDLDTTAHRGMATVGGITVYFPEPNVEDANGEIHADTVIPDAIVRIGGQPIVREDVHYTASLFGLWSEGSQYHWSSQTSGYYDEGTWNPEAVMPFDVPYFIGMQPGTVDRIHLRLTDASDGFSLETNYYLHFHNKYEDWETLSTVQHPLQLDPSISRSGGDNWVLVAESATTATILVEDSREFSTSGTIGSKLVSQFDDPLGFIQLELNWSITSTSLVRATVSQSILVNPVPGTAIGVFKAPCYDDLTGMASLWTIGGYSGMVPTAGTRYYTSYRTDKKVVQKWY